MGFFQFWLKSQGQDEAQVPPMHRQVSDHPCWHYHTQTQAGRRRHSHPPLGNDKAEAEKAKRKA